MKAMKNGSHLRAVAAALMCVVVVVANVSAGQGNQGVALSCGWQDVFGSSGFDDYVDALAVYNDGSGDALYVGGQFSTAGGLASWKMAKWRCDIPFFSDGFESGGTAAWSNTVP